MDRTVELSPLEAARQLRQMAERACVQAPDDYASRLAYMAGGMAALLAQLLGLEPESVIQILSILDKDLPD